MMNRRQLGELGEAYAAQRLEADGYRILDRNWRVLEGELDLIAERHGKWVFVEVRTRTSKSFGSPEESFTERKKKRVVRAALRYLEAKELLAADWRVDMIAVECSPDGEISRFDHYEDVIQGRLEDFL